MTKKFLAVLRYTVVAAMMASFFVLSGCSDDDKGPVVYDGTILDLIKSDDYKQALSGDPDTALDSLVLYINKFPDLAAILSGTADVTLFAPSNTAFVSLTALPGLKDPDLINQDIIKGVLAYHIVTGKKMQADLSAGVSVTTNYNSEAILVNGDGTLKTGSSNPNIVIKKSDLLAKNGVVHITQTVLIPPSTGGQLAAILGSLGATVLLGKDFTYMAYMIARADAGVDAAATFTAMIAKGSNLTLLAIPNPVFVGAFNAANAQPPTNVPTSTQVKAFIDAAFTTGGTGTATLTLKNHLLPGKYVVTAVSGSTTFANATTINAVSTKALNISTGLTPVQCSCATGVLISAAKTGGGTSNAPIVQADISTSAGISNGILQVVGGIILP